MTGNFTDSYYRPMTHARDTGGVDTPGRRFAVLISDARSRAGMTQEQLVDVSGVTRQTIIRYESGRAVNPKPLDVRAVCLALGLHPREAAIALGYCTREEMGAATPSDPTTDEVTTILQDTRIPDTDRQSWIQYLRYLHNKAS